VALVLVVAVLAPAAAAKGKKVACKGAKVAVTVGKKTTCQPFAQVFPKPEAIDPRLAHLQQALKFDPAKAVHGKKRKRARTLQSGFGAAGKRAQKKLLKLLPKALAFIDRQGGGARLSRLQAEPAVASRGCEPGPAGPSGQTGGATIGALGDNGGFIDAPAGGNLRVRVTFVSCGGVSAFRIPECPTANGSVDATGSGEFRATLEIWDGDQLVSRNSSTFEEKAKVHGEVGADAKLKFIEVEHSQEVFIVASGGIVIRGGVTRKVRIDMPGGRYDPARAGVRFFGDKIASDSGASAFASTADAAIRGYGSAEPRWSSFDAGAYCAEPVFAPASNTLKLRKGDNKQLSIYAKARSDGGQATEARWTLLNQENAVFSPASSQAAAPTISYVVTDAPENGFVKVKVKFTSTAGVGEKTWTQPTEKGPTINEIAGTFSQTTVQHIPKYGDSAIEFSGNITFERFTPAIFGGADGLFKRKEGTMSVSVSGNGAMFASAPLCSQRGTLQLAIAAESSISVLGTGPEQREPYEYAFSIASNSNPEPPKLSLEIYACDEVAEEQEGFYEIPVSFGMFGKGLYVSPDGITYSGSETEDSSAVTVTETWSFHGTE
jgi:hypothetical protein